MAFWVSLAREVALLAACDSCRGGTKPELPCGAQSYRGTGRVREAPLDCAFGADGLLVACFFSFQALKVCSLTWNRGRDALSLMRSRATNTFASCFGVGHKQKSVVSSEILKIHLDLAALHIGREGMDR